MSRARFEYVSSLKKINMALKSPTEAIKDSTLVSILNVAVLEAIAVSLKEWTEHVIGAATLLKMRGRTQLSTPVGVELFMAASSRILISCIQRETAMPPQHIELRAEAFQYVPSDPERELLKLMEHFTVFRSDIKPGMITNLRAIIARAMQLDEQINKIFSNVPQNWLYETVVTGAQNELI